MKVRLGQGRRRASWVLWARFLTLLGLLVALMIPGGFAFADAATCTCDRPLGGEVPFPLSLNALVELADGEDYLLVGAIRLNIETRASRASRIDVSIGGKSGGDSPLVWFEVDFREHPWLQNRNRRVFPYYLIEADHLQEIDWRWFEGKRVKLRVKARTEIHRGSDGLRASVILLPEAVPEIYNLVPPRVRAQAPEGTR